jgi:hypothetical protein
MAAPLMDKYDWGAAQDAVSAGTGAEAGADPVWLADCAMTVSGNRNDSAMAAAMRAPKAEKDLPKVIGEGPPSRWERASSRALRQA